MSTSLIIRHTINHGPRRTRLFSTSIPTHARRQTHPPKPPRSAPTIAQAVSSRQPTAQPLAFASEATHHPPEPLYRPTKPKTTPSNIRRWRRIPLIGLVLSSFAIAFSIPYVYYSYKREAAYYRDASIPADNSRVFDQVADEYDRSVGNSEYWMGFLRLRRKLLAKARGHVLEASVGTGRNAEFYPLTKGIRSVTMVDKSGEMVRVARMNWAKTNAWYINAMFRIQSAGEAVPFPSGSPDGFDTVVQTMGVCSTGDPVGVLKNLGRMTKPDGRILLLEHGKGKYEWLNNFLDESAPAHAARWGCWFNKDVGAIVRESGLEVIEEKRFDFGTTWWFVLKPPQDRSVLEVKKPVVEVVEDSASKNVSQPWWAVWR